MASKDIGEMRGYCKGKSEVQKGRGPHSAEVGQKSEEKLAVSVLLFTEKTPFPLYSKC